MTISVVQTKTGGTATTAASLTITLTSATTAGNCLVVCVAASHASGTTAATISSITLGGSAGNFAKAAGVNMTASTGGGRSDCEIWADPSCAGGQTSVVITPASSEGIAAVVFEVSGLAAASIADQSSTNTAASTGSTWTSNTSGTTTLASELAVGAVASVTDGTWAGPSGYTNSTVTADSGVLTLEAGYKILSSAGTAVYNSTQAGDTINCGYAAVVATLKTGSAGGLLLLL